MEDVHVIKLLMNLALSVSILVSVYRIWKGPSDLDRVVSLEYLGIICVTFVVWYGWMTKEQVFIDVAIAMASLSFIGTVSFSKWLAYRSA